MELSAVASNSTMAVFRAFGRRGSCCGAREAQEDAKLKAFKLESGPGSSRR